MKKAVELLEDQDVKNNWQRKRKKMLSEKIDTTKFMVEFIEGYQQDSGNNNFVFCINYIFYKIHYRRYNI